MKKEGYNIYHHLYIKKETKFVFDAITLPRHLNNWWSLKSTGDPQMGAEYHFHFGNGYDWYAEVIRCEANSSFHVKMLKSDKDWLSTSLGFDLQKDENETSLSFQHINWPHCNIHFKTTSYCWAILLKDLKNYIEKGVIVPFEERS